MTDPDLSALEGLLGEATPGLWAIDGRFLVTSDKIELDMERRCIADLDYFHMPFNHANAALIVAAVNALPALLAIAGEVEGLRAENEALREALKDLCDAWDISKEDGPRTDRFRGNVTEAQAAARSALNQPSEGVTSSQERHPASGGVTSPGSETPMHWRKKPVVIEAHQWTKHGFTLAPEWLAERERVYGGFVDGTCRREDEDLLIQTLEGTMRALPGDWIIKGVQGEIYPCKPDIFATTYEPADAARPAPTADDGPGLTPSNEDGAS